MRRAARFGVASVLSAGLLMVPLVAVGAAPAAPSPGAPGVGDPYYPLDGNGGYDVAHYNLAVKYNPATDKIVGTAGIVATATQALSRFDLDLSGLTVRSITVNGNAATWSRSGQELKITPSSALAKGDPFVTVVKYDGVPAIIDDPALGQSGFFTTPDGAFIAGQPHGAATWFPVNDHPIDKATYSFEITAPKALQVIANGYLVGSEVKGSQRTTAWVAPDKMASYLSTIAIGNYRTTSYSKGGVKYYDGIASSLYVPFSTPTDGTQFAIAGRSVSAYQRLAHTIAVPAGGANLSFDINRSTETGYDYVFVEARTAGSDDWTTLPDVNGHTQPVLVQDAACSYGLWAIHPFLKHYITVNDDGSCSPTGTTGKWNAATGESDGVEKWKVDLSAFAGRSAEVSITVVTDDVLLYKGVTVDNVVSSTGVGSTSFEADGTTLDGWTTPGAPDGSPGNTDDWIAGTAADITTTGDIASASLKREPEIVSFLSSNFGPYPWKASGGIVTNAQDQGFALETQTRPIYSPAFFDSVGGGSNVIAHELTHQWYGDSLAVKQWKEIWLNEGFATYAEWLWSEHEGSDTPAEIFSFYAGVSADDPFWSLKIGDPGPDTLFDGAVYTRGAMTLQALREKIGDKAFFTLLKQWAASHAGGNVTTAQFIALAEKLSGQKLGSFFTTWLYTGSKPAGLDSAAAARSLAASATVPALQPRSDFLKIQQRLAAGS